jgi:signal transduction histidine kinase
VEDFSGTSRPLTRAVPDVRVGPMLLAPLIAHDTMLGVLIVTRDRGGPVFTKREAHRLRVIADHAALALWKAELLEEAQAADRAKGRFLATVSHELRTPLTALAGYEELLADQVIGPLSDNQLDVLERMRAVTQHLSVVIEEVLAFSSLEDGRETVRPTEFLAADLVHAAAAVIEPLARQKKLTFTYHLPDEPIRMSSDVDKIRQILVNLAGNAVKFTDRGEVRLDLERQDHIVRFIVRDTGIGIAPNDLARLFRPFAQLDTGLTRRHGGTGLGLYISRRLAELLGGRIDVKSELGQGSEFALVLLV